jgi:hypothetical protein
MTLAMAIATRKQKQAARQSTGKRAPTPVRTKAAAKAGEPERSSPALAEVDAEALEFIAAIDRFKQEHGRPFPSWSEILLVVRQLGYRRG